MQNHFENVVKILSVEADAIRAAAERINRQAVEKAITLLSNCNGKIVVLGIGKSGVIAQKISQTMTSTGTVAVFVHPSDALHGSLGVIKKDDVVITISNSGETEEILALLPTLKNRDIKIISIVGNLDSTLARESDVVLDSSVDEEVCPLNLAPTTSTTVSLSIGDAIAMTLMQIKGLTEQDFAENHPAGRLGKRLTIKVKNLMQESPNIGLEANWLEVVKIISKYALGAVNVIDEKGKLVGIVTDGDLRRMLENTSPADFGKLKASAMMTKNPVTVKAEKLAFEALKLMENRPKQISVLPVVDADDNCIGLLRLHDIVRSGL